MSQMGITEAVGPVEGMKLRRVHFDQIKPGMQIFRREGLDGRWRNMGFVEKRISGALLMKCGRKMRKHNWGGRRLWFVSQFPNRQETGGVSDAVAT